MKLFQTRDIRESQLPQERAFEGSEREEYRKLAGVQQHPGGRRRSRDLKTWNDEVGSKEKKKKYRTVVYIYSDQPAHHSYTSNQDKISDGRYFPEVRQPMHALVNTDDLSVTSRNQSVLIEGMSSGCDMRDRLTSSDRSPSLEGGCKDYEAHEGLKSFSVEPTLDRYSAKVGEYCSNCNTHIYGETQWSGKFHSYDKYRPCKVWEKIVFHFFAPWCSEFNFRIQLIHSFKYNPGPQ
jgi:hypothetical protein